MAKIVSFVNRDRESSPLGPRLHLARRKRGFSLRKLSEATDGAVSHEHIRKLEAGLKVPDDATLAVLCQALDVTREELMAPTTITLGEIEFRKRYKTTSADRVAIREELLELLERYLEVEDILELDDEWKPPVIKATLSADGDAYAEKAALELRKQWDLGLGPILDFTNLLENKGYKVCIPKASLDISGLTCEVHRPGRASVNAIVVNHDHSLERRRFTMAHELGHCVLTGHGLTGPELEGLCNRFAAAFLVPRVTLQREMGKRPRLVAYREIMLTKKFFRVSAAMIVMRLEQVGILDRLQRDWFFQTIGNGWRKTEPEPLEESAAAKLEQPRFELLVYRALISDFISAGKAAELLGVRIEEIEHGLRGGR